MTHTTTEPAALSPAPSASVLDEHARGWRSKLWQAGLVLAVVFFASWYENLLDFRTLANGVPAIATLLRESLPPDFTNVMDWMSPLLDTLAMSIAGTAIAVSASVPLAFLAARNTTPHPAVFHLTDHYRSYAYVLIRIASVDPDWLKAELVSRWQKVAPATLKKVHPELLNAT